jgi:hypothetical protein
MLRIAGSLVTNRVRAYDLLRMLTRDGNPTPLGQALAEYGRIPKTLHLLAMIDPVDETYRRIVTRQQNIVESRHALARKIFYGNRGEIAQAYPRRTHNRTGTRSTMSGSSGRATSTRGRLENFGGQPDHSAPRSRGSRLPATWLGGPGPRAR